MDTLLVCTVGGTPEPVVKALTHWRPTRIRFVCTPRTVSVAEHAVQCANDEGLAIDAGRYDILEFTDGQDLVECVDRLRDLAPEVESWVARGEDFQVVADITGGTKSMSCALAIQAARWPHCVYSYVGGEARTKDGIGEPKAWSSRVLDHANPWESLALQAIDEFTILFDERAFTAAERVADDAMRRVVTRSDRKRALAALTKLARAFEAWERFDHKRAAGGLREVRGAANDLRAALGPERWERVRTELDRAERHVTEVARSTPPSRAHVLDLLANACRRRRQGRFDDAAARLYRAVEALAQVALRGHGFENTSKVEVERVPEALCGKWRPRAVAGFVKLGLQDAYGLLASLHDPLGTRFRELGLDAESSSLSARNTSILAHGFECVSDEVVEQLWKAALALADCREEDLPVFPRLARAIERGRWPRGG